MNKMNKFNYSHLPMYSADDMVVVVTVRDNCDNDKNWMAYADAIQYCKKNRMGFIVTPSEMAAAEIAAEEYNSYHGTNYSVEYFL